MPCIMTEDKQTPSVIKTVLDAVTYLDDKKVSKRALPLCFSAPGGLAAVEMMVERYGYEWLQSRLDSQLAWLSIFRIRFESIGKIAEGPVDFAWVSWQYQLALSRMEQVSGLSHSHLLVLANTWASHPRLNARLLPLLQKRYGADELSTFNMTSFLASLCRANCIPESFTQEVAGIFSELSSARSWDRFWESAEDSHDALTIVS